MSDHESLQTLHTALIDTRNGYEAALKDTDNPDVTPILTRARELHASAHDDVHRLLEEGGAAPEDEGSLMSTVHEAVIGVRSAVVGLDRGALSAFARGEESNLAKYDDAIAAEPRNADFLRRHRSSLAALVEEMKKLAGS